MCLFYKSVNCILNKFLNQWNALFKAKCKSMNKEFILPMWIPGVHKPNVVHDLLRIQYENIWVHPLHCNATSACITIYNFNQFFKIKNQVEISIYLVDSRIVKRVLITFYLSVMFPFTRKKKLVLFLENIQRRYQKKD